MACFFICLMKEYFMIGFAASAVVAAIWLMAGFALCYAIKTS